MNEVQEYSEADGLDREQRPRTHYGRPVYLKEAGIMRYNDYLQALAQGLVDDLGVHVTVVTHERKEASQYHDHTPPFVYVDFIIDDRVTLSVHYKFMNSWRGIGPAWYRTITFQGNIDGTGAFIHFAVNAWLAGQCIYEHIMKMDSVTMIQPVNVAVEAGSFKRGWHEVMTGDVSPVDTLWEGIED